MPYHASLITADGAYHCPVGSIMAIFSIKYIKNRKVEIGNTSYSHIKEATKTNW